MQNDLRLIIKFSKRLSEDEQMHFWQSLISELEKMDLKAGGGHDSEKLDWVIDYSDSTLNKNLIMDKIKDYLLTLDDIVALFTID